MRKPLSLSSIKMLLEFPPVLEKPMPPAPFPGRRFPTRVAWVFNAQGTKQIPHPTVPGAYALQVFNQKFQYIGKPNRLRARAAANFLQQHKGEITYYLEAEFDRTGIVASRHKFPDMKAPASAVSARYWVYHPQAAQTPAIVDCFTHPQFMKRLGGFTVYSFNRKLEIEKVDQFYEWYSKTFGKRLRRPKGKPLEIGDTGAQNGSF